MLPEMSSVDVSLPGGLCIQESSVFTPGEQLRV